MKNGEISRFKRSIDVTIKKSWKMEEVFLRFLHLGQQIFDKLDIKTLKKWAWVSREWQQTLINENILSVRVIQDYTNCSKALLKKTFQQQYFEANFMKTLAKDVHYVYNTPFLASVFTPLHAAANFGKQFVCQLLINKNGVKMPKKLLRFTPLHLAAGKGHLEVCQILTKHLDDKNPKDKDGNTPLHHSAFSGHLKVHEFLMNNVEDKNPKNHYNVTPHDNAKQNGHTAVCGLITSKIYKRNKRRRLV